ncbi:hypothetical protein [Chryseobacterium oryctis]|uniref:Uncharacterized protein n=1 Tax=Chryseobacterium oryctis TaxID=2952618 RepID=A0ABT3HQB1_9FLAO|nr:hypothetical protein [Chryseobacterium oryctis]MCW3161970.1 hypothetical protein [Chryseobacterium oryctis]
MKTKPILNVEDISEVSEPSVLSTDFVQNLINNYRANQLQAINNEMQTSDAHSIWFSLEKLKKLINDIETETQKVDENIKTQDLGIRFYYGAYPKIENWDTMEGYPIPDTYAGKHTLVMIPTISRPDEEGNYLNFDFNPLNPNSYNQISNEGGSVIAMASRNAQIGTLAENHGALVPPEKSNAEIF